MKRKFSIVSATALFLFACPNLSSCGDISSSVAALSSGSSEKTAGSSQTQESSGATSSDSSLASDPDGFSIASFSSFKAIGVASKTEKALASGAKGLKKRKAEAYNETYSSSRPFNLVGLSAASDYADLRLVNAGGQYFQGDYTIGEFYNLSAFYRFGLSSLEDYKNRTMPSFASSVQSSTYANMDLKKFYCEVGDLTGQVYFRSCNWTGMQTSDYYLISKKTGKIFNFGKKFFFSEIHDYDSGFYAKGYALEEGYPYKISEENPHYEGKESVFRIRETGSDGILSIERLFAVSAANIFRIDRNGIINFTDKRFYGFDNKVTPAPATPASFDFDRLSRRFYYVDSGSYYVLNAKLVFEKYGDAFSNPYSFPSDTKGETPYDDWNAAVNIDDRLFGSASVSYFFHQYKYNTHTTDDYFSPIPHEGFALLKVSLIDQVKYTVEVTFSEEFSSTSSEKQEDMKFFNRDLILFNSCLYSYASPNIYKLDIRKGEVKQIDIGSDYDVRSLEEDVSGHLVLKGYKNSDLSEFTGYLTAEDQLTFDLGDNPYESLTVYSVN